MIDHTGHLSLTIEEAPSHSLSIRPTSGGLAFSITVCVEQEANFTSFLPYASIGTPIGQQIEELYYQNEWLAFPYATTYLYYEPHEAVLVPEELLTPGQESLWLAPDRDHASERLALPENPKVGLSVALLEEGKSLVLSWDQRAYTFLKRRHSTLEPLPYFIPLLVQRRADSQKSRGHELLLVLREQGVDCLLLLGGELIAFNSYPIVRLQDADQVAGEVMFYASTLWRHFGISSVSDRIHIAHSEEGTEATVAILRSSAQKLCAILSRYVGAVSLEPYRVLALR